MSNSPLAKDQSLQQEIEALSSRSLETLASQPDAREVFNRFKMELNRGSIRAADKQAGQWQVNTWVKKGILLGFRLGVLAEVPAIRPFAFFDKDTFMPKTIGPEDGIRVVAGGSSFRDGCYIARGVTCMPPMFVNAGAYVDEGTMIDSHALVGSCAQIGKRVHLSAAAQIGGVLEPVGELPVIIEDDVLVGGNCGIYEGTIVRARAVIGAGTVLTASTPVYDLVREQIYKRTETQPLVIPEGAVVVPGSRAVKTDWGRETGLSLHAPVIVKYRDSNTDQRIRLEDWLR